MESPLHGAQYSEAGRRYRVVHSSPVPVVLMTNRQRMQINTDPWNNSQGSNTDLVPSDVVRSGYSDRLLVQNSILEPAT